MRGRAGLEWREDALIQGKKALQGSPWRGWSYDAPALFMSSPESVAVKGGMGMPLVVGCTEP